MSLQLSFPLFLSFVSAFFANNQNVPHNRQSELKDHANLLQLIGLRSGRLHLETAHYSRQGHNIRLGLYADIADDNPLHKRNH